MGVDKEKYNYSEFELSLAQKEEIAFWKIFLIITVLVTISIIIGIKNYLFFHSLIEMAEIFVGIGVSVTVYHSTKIMKNGIFRYFGLLFLFLGVFQIIHFFSYNGVSVFQLNGYNIAIQISISSKLLDSLSMLLLIILPIDVVRNNLNVKKIFITYFTVSTLITIFLVYNKYFPQCANENAEPTTFKFLGEGIILGLYVVLLILAFIKKSQFDKKVINYIFGYLILRIIAQILFVSCMHVNDYVNVLAHIIKFITYCIVYKVIAIGVIDKPLIKIFGEIQQKASELEEANKHLKLEVEQCLMVEELLRKSEKQHRMLLESIPYAVFLNDREKILFINQAGLKLFGYENSQQVIDKPIADMFGEKRYEQYLDKLNQVAKESSPLVFEHKAMINNEYIYVEVITSVYNVENKNEFLSVARDISSKKQFEEMKKNADENTRLLKKVTEMDRLKTDYVTNLSHEFRTPLSIMLCTLKIMESSYKNKSNIVYDNEKLSKYISSMKNNSYRLLKTANNLLEITKIESGNGQLKLKNYNIVRIVEKVTNSVLEYTRTRKISLIFDTDAEEIITACDLDKIEGIMLNLLSNAIKFTRERGKIEVSIFDQKQYVLITVSDTGIGIPGDKLNLIFERFKQVDNSLTRAHEGTGIGLALVMSFVEMHGGKIDVESEVGVGSTFRVLIPVRVLDSEFCLNYSVKEAELERSINEKINIELSNV